MPRPKPRILLLACALSLSGCKWVSSKSSGSSLAPPDSYLLFVPQPAGQGSLVKQADLKTQEVQPIPGLLETGFASEMLRTVYLADQFIRDAIVDGKPFPEPARTLAAAPVCLVVGVDKLPYGRGLTVKGGFFGGEKQWPGIPWLGIPAEPSRDKALIQTLAGRFATFAAHLVATGGLLDQAASPPPPVLIDGYRMAMEVIAREWRHRVGPAGVIQTNEGTNAQRELFGNIRDNRYVLDESGKSLRSARALLDSAGVAGTIIYRMAQSGTVGKRVAPEAFYAPFAKNRMPQGVSPAAILGPFRNFQAKLLGVWATAVARGKAPKDIAELVDLYGATFPVERYEVIRIFVVTTFGGTVKPGGCSMDPKDSRQTLAELTVLTGEVVARRKSLRQALSEQPSE